LYVEKSFLTLGVSMQSYGALNLITKTFSFFFDMKSSI
jgi:hypothetical protein